MRVSPSRVCITPVVKSKVLRPRVALLGEPVGEVVGVRLGDLEPEVVGELDDRLRPHASVEVVVQRHLWEATDRHAVQDGVTVLVDGHVLSSVGQMASDADRMPRRMPQPRR
jgi:hypothetical protein